MASGIKGESLGDAAARCVLEAERFGNEGKARIHLDIKPEIEPLPGQSQFAATLAKALVNFLYVEQEISDDTSAAMQQKLAGVVDKEVDNIRDAFKNLPPCPIITHHPEGPCSFCAAYALRDILILKEPA